MNDYSQGFLTEPFDEVRKVIREEYANWRDLVYNLNKQCVEAQHNLNIKADDTRDKLCAALFARTLASTQGTILLLEVGLLAQAQTVLRSAIESLFRLAALEVKPDLAVLLAQSQEADKRSLADKILQWEAVDLKTSMAELIDEQELIKIKSNKSQEFKTYDFTVTAGLKDYYLSTYALLSFPTHATISDLDSHLIKDNEGNIIGLKNEPIVLGQDFSWQTTIDIQLKAAKSVTGVFGDNSIDIEVYEKNFRKLIEQAD